MKLISTAALAAVLATGTIAVAITPAVAVQKKDKKKEEGAPQLKLSDEVRKPVAAAQTALAAKDMATASQQLAIAEPLAKTDDEKYIVNALKLGVVAGGTDRTAMIPILDVLIANPKTPAADVPRFTYFRGALPFEQRKYAEALPFLQKARELGYQDENLTLQIAQALVETGNVAGGLTEVDTAVKAEEAAGKKAPEDLYNYAVSKSFTSGQTALTAQWLQRLVSAYPTTQNWRKVIIVYRDSHEGAKATKPLARAEKIDLYRLMRATKALADRGDYLEYADITYQAGLPYETKAVIDEGRSTGKLPAGDKASTELYTLAQAAIAKDTPLATLEKQAASAPTGKPAMNTADVYLAQGNYAKAVPLYRTALEKGGVDASEANLRLGQALIQSGDAAGGKTALTAVTAAPRSDIAGFWNQWVAIAPNVTGN